MDESYRNAVETLSEFKLRTSFKDEPLRAIGVPKNQTDKIRKDGFFETMLGDTVTFSLPGDFRKALGAVRDALYHDFRNLLSQPLPDHTLHITLHDLSHSPLDQMNQIAETIKAHRPQVEQILRQLRILYPRPIRLRPTNLISMVGRSVVLLFEPATDADCMALTDMYRRFDAVVPLPYALTPHVTLAYYKPQAIADRDARALGEAFGRILRAHPLSEIALETGWLDHRCFTSMASYMSHDQFLSRMQCTPEEFRARMEFDNMYLCARNLIAGGVSVRKTLHTMTGWQLDMSIAQQQRKWRPGVDSMIGSFPYDPDDLYANSPSCTAAVGGAADHRFLCAVIVMNLYARGFLDDAAYVYGKDGLVHHCLFTLGWQQ